MSETFDFGLGTFILPQPESKVEYVKIPRLSRTIPFGYVVDSEDDGWLQPVALELDALEKAKKYLKQYSSRQVAAWLTTVTGREISHVGPTNANPLLIESLPKGTKKPLRKRKSTKKEPEQKTEASSIVIDTSNLASPSPIEVVQPERDNVIFRPNPGPQTNFLAASEREVLYGGAAGGGKSYAILADPLRYMAHPQFSGLILRHTTEELRDLEISRDVSKDISRHQVE
jgi:hypothetical protein